VEATWIMYIRFLGARQDRLSPEACHPPVQGV
jgi:hypothetical protein